jgi:Tol biopolymer transport system component
MRRVVLLVASFLALGVFAGGLRAESASRGGGRIIFQYGESGALRPAQMAVMDADGKNRRDLPLDHTLSSTLSPDGRIVMYTVYPEAVWVMNLDGRPRYRRLVRHGCAANWSPSGRSVLFVRPHCYGPASASSIWTLDTKTNRQRLVIRNGFEPRWSPDGRSLAFVRGGDIWIAAIRTHGAHRLIRRPQGTERLAEPSWSPDGRRIAFDRIVEQKCCGERSSVYVARADGTGQRRISESGGSPAWSPNSREIAYVGKSGHFFDAVIRVRLDGSGRRVLFGSQPYCGCSSVSWSR